MGRGGKNLDSRTNIDDQPEDASVLTASSPLFTEQETGKGEYTWEEVRRHSSKKDRWLVIDKRVYDVSRWYKHPGGQVVLNHYAGQDATVSCLDTSTIDM